ncbi:MAG TPA: beta-galactosidase GalB [Tepidisphaeraceae bacterium]
MLDYLRFAAVGLLAFFVGCAANPVARQRVSFDNNWRFTRGDAPDANGQLDYARIKPWVKQTGSEFVSNPHITTFAVSGTPGADVSFVQPKFDDHSWRQLNLPHDFGIEGPFDQALPGNTAKLPWAGVAWYRKHFLISSLDRGQRFYLDVDGAMSYATVWLNGHFVGGWPYGYTSFELDLTPYIKFDRDNVLAIRLDNPPDSSRWYPGGGIYRNVWLVKTPQVHVAHWGTYVTTNDVSCDSADVNVQVNVVNSSKEPAMVTVSTEFFAPNREGRLIPVASLRPQGYLPKQNSEMMDSVDLTIPPGQTAPCDNTRTILHPELWDLDHPTEYLAVTTIRHKGRIIDRYKTRFGIRTIHFDANTGFSLNGKHVRIQGVCDHHDLGALGAAINTRALERQIELLKSMGCNAIRTSHNPPAPELLDLCDRMGMLVMDESFDCWEKGKTPNDYHLLFRDWHEKDWRAELRRDRNHPSIILWSIGNEIPDQETARGIPIGNELTQIAHEEDPTRPTTAACNDVNSAFDGFNQTLDVFGYNYQWKSYGRFHEANPNQPIFGSETASCISSRGEYFFPVSDDKLTGNVNFQVSSYDLSAPRWAWPPDDEFAAEDKNKEVAGEFVWTGFDYLGEPTPYGGNSKKMLDFTDPKLKAKAEAELQDQGEILVPSRSSYFGIIDLAGFPKDRFYLYQARWRPDFPMAHILPHWNWPDRVGQVTPVFVYTSGDEAELFLNGHSLGRKRILPGEYRLRWDDVVYQPGELHVVAFKHGHIWAEDTVETTGPASKLLMCADRSYLSPDGNDLAFITVKIADANDQTVPQTHNHIVFHIHGPGEIVAVDNGDATSFEPFQAKEHDAFNGLCLAIVRTLPGKTGKIWLSAESPGLKGDTISMRVH